MALAAMRPSDQHSQHSRRSLRSDDDAQQQQPQEQQDTPPQSASTAAVAHSATQHHIQPQSLRRPPPPLPTATTKQEQLLTHPQLPAPPPPLSHLHQQPPAAAPAPVPPPPTPRQPSHPLHPPPPPPPPQLQAIPPRLPSLASLYHDVAVQPPGEGGPTAPHPAPPHAAQPPPSSVIHHGLGGVGGASQLPLLGGTLSSPSRRHSLPSLGATRAIGAPRLGPGMVGDAYRGAPSALGSGGGVGSGLYAGGHQQAPPRYLGVPGGPGSVDISVTPLVGGAAAGPSRRIPLPLPAVKRKPEGIGGGMPSGSIKDYCALLTPFIYKLYCLVSDSSTDALCGWAEDGRAFIVRDPTAFAATVLPNYFKHNQFSSFVRQLNKYRFHKLAPGAFLFGHDKFVRGRPDLLPDIGRQRSPDRAPPPATPPPATTSPVTKRPRTGAGASGSASGTGIGVGGEGAEEQLRAALTGEIAPLRGDVNALRRENSSLHARVQALEDTVAALRHNMDYLQHAMQTQRAEAYYPPTLRQPPPPTSSHQMPNK